VLAAEEPPGKLSMGTAHLAAKIPLDFGPEVDGWDARVEEHEGKPPFAAFDFFDTDTCPVSPSPDKK
jgi:hypothetical protein